MKNKRKYGNPEKQLAWENRKKSILGSIIDRNGCKVYYPLNMNQEQLASIFETCDIWAIDNLYGKNWNIVQKSIESNVLNCLLQQEGNPEKQLSFTANIDIKTLIKQIYENNFKSLDLFVKNMLPTFNGPDRACFIGLTGDEGITWGFKFDIPTCIAN